MIDVFARPSSAGERRLRTNRALDALEQAVYDRALQDGVIRRRGPWRRLETVEFATLDWVDWFNHRRLLEPIGYVPPAEYEARSCEQAAVADSPYAESARSHPRATGTEASKCVVSPHCLWSPP